MEKKKQKDRISTFRIWQKEKKVKERMRTKIGE